MDQMKNFKDMKMSSSQYLKPIADWPSRCSSFFNALLVERRHRPHLPQVLKTTQWPTATSKLIQQQRDKMNYKQMKSDPSSSDSSYSSSSKVHQLN